MNPALIVLDDEDLRSKFVVDDDDGVDRDELLTNDSGVGVGVIVDTGETDGALLQLATRIKIIS